MVKSRGHSIHARVHCARIPSKYFDSTLEPFPKAVKSVGGAVSRSNLRDVKAAEGSWIMIDACAENRRSPWQSGKDIFSGKHYIGRCTSRLCCMSATRDRRRHALRRRGRTHLTSMNRISSFGTLWCVLLLLSGFLVPLSSVGDLICAPATLLRFLIAETRITAFL